MHLSPWSLEKILGQWKTWLIVNRETNWITGTGTSNTVGHNIFAGSKFATKKYSTKKLCLFYYNLVSKWLKWWEKLLSLVLHRVSMPKYCLKKILCNYLSGSFWKSQKLISSKKNQSVLIAKITSHKIHKIANLQKKNPKNLAKISCHTVKANISLIYGKANKTTMTLNHMVLPSWSTRFLMLGL